MANPKTQNVESVDFLNMNPEELAKQLAPLVEKLGSLNPPRKPEPKKQTTKPEVPNKMELIGKAMSIASDKKKWLPIVIVIAYLFGSGIVANTIWIIQLIKLLISSF